MKYSRFVLGSFLCIALIQIAMPVSMIAQREITLRNGRQFRFRTMPVDPYDAFRGRYVALRIEQTNVPLINKIKFVSNQKVYVRIEENDQGFTNMTEVTVNRPEGYDYLQARVDYVFRKKIYLRLPFDRYYLDENIAPAAEQAYREHSRRGRQDAFVTVRVKSGFAVLEELYIGEMPITDFILKKQNRQ